MKTEGLLYHYIVLYHNIHYTAYSFG